MRIWKPIFALFMAISAVLLSCWGGKLEDYKSFKITTPAMEPTISAGQIVLADMGAYKDNDIKFLDIVIFIAPNSPEEKYVKRCIGLPGDTIWFIEKKLWKNGMEIDESYYTQFASDMILPADAKVPDPYELSNLRYGITNNGKRPFPPFRDNSDKIVIPKDNYFVVGDNRDNSLDSRMFGFVERKSILGKIIGMH